MMLSVKNESEFEVCYLGMVQNVNLGMHLSEKSDVLLIDKIEEAQVDFLNIIYIFIFCRYCICQLGPLRHHGCR